MINTNLLNYPLPIISVNKDGFVTAKSNSFDTIFKVVHVGASASKYTDISFDKEILSTGVFCDVRCTYCTLFNGDETLLILSPESFGEASLTERILLLYRDKINKISANHSDEVKGVERKYTKAVNDKIIKANYFNTFRSIIERKEQTQNLEDEQSRLSKICTAIMLFITNSFEDVDVKFDIDYLCDNLITSTTESNIVNIILNSIAFSIINTTDSIVVGLTENNSVAELIFSFYTKSTFEEILNPSEDSALNSSLSFIFATELAKSLGYSYSISREHINQKTDKYTLLYKIPVDVKKGIILSSDDSVTPIVKKMFSLIFFDSFN